VERAGQGERGLLRRPRFSFGRAVFIKVLSPSPFSPTSTCTSPGKTLKSTPSRIFTCGAAGYRCSMSLIARLSSNFRPRNLTRSCAQMSTRPSFFVAQAVARGMNAWDAKAR
jgi:hypothetical protein